MISITTAGQFASINQVSSGLAGFSVLGASPETLQGLIPQEGREALEVAGCASSFESLQGALHNGDWLLARSLQWGIVRALGEKAPTDSLQGSANAEVLEYSRQRQGRLKPYLNRQQRDLLRAKLDLFFMDVDAEGEYESLLHFKNLKELLSWAEKDYRALLVCEYLVRNLRGAILEEFKNALQEMSVGGLLRRIEKKPTTLLHIFNFLIEIGHVGFREAMMHFDIKPLVQVAQSKPYMASVLNFFARLLGRDDAREALRLLAEQGNNFAKIYYERLVANAVVRKAREDSQEKISADLIKKLNFQARNGNTFALEHLLFFAKAEMKEGCVEWVHDPESAVNTVIELATEFARPEMPQPNLLHVITTFFDALPISWLVPMLESEEEVIHIFHQLIELWGSSRCAEALQLVAVFNPLARRALWELARTANAAKTALLGATLLVGGG